LHDRFPPSSVRKSQQQNGIAAIKRMAMKFRDCTLQVSILRGSIRAHDAYVNSRYP